MITSADQAIDDMFKMLRDAWLLDVDTAPIDIVYGNVAHDYHGQFTVAGDPIPWLNAQVLHETSRRASLRGQAGPGTPAGSRNVEEGSIVAALHAPEGEGNAGPAKLISVAMRAFQGKRSPNGVVFIDPQITDLGRQGTWYLITMTTTFRYDLIE